jgi:hypothetical protein
MIARDDSTTWVAMVDLLCAILAVVIVAVNPVHAKVDGVKPKAEFLIQAEWDVNRDIDNDLWVQGPAQKPVFYGSRQVGCADLDRDSLGFSTSHVTLADGSMIKSKSNIETVTLRCLEPGRWDVAVNRFADHTGERGEPIKVHVEVTALNPTVRLAWAGDVTINHLGETINAVSFELGQDGSVHLVSVPLEPLTSAYERAEAGGAP